MSSARTMAHTRLLSCLEGCLFVYGPTSDYVLAPIGSRMISGGSQAESVYYAHDIIAYELNAGDSAIKINSELRPGKTMKGRLVGPTGETVDKAEIVARSTSITSTLTGVGTSRFTPATARSSCMGSIRRNPRVYRSLTPTISGERPSSFPASRLTKS